MSGASIGADVPRRASCRLSGGERFEAEVLRIGTTSVFLSSDREDLRYSDGVQVTLLDRHGPVLTFSGHVSTWVRRRGARIEAAGNTDIQVLDQLGEWATEELQSTSTRDLPTTGELPVVEQRSSFRAPTRSPSAIMSARGVPASPADVFVLPDVWGEPAPPPAPEPVSMGHPVPLPGLGSEVGAQPAANRALAGCRVLVIDDDAMILRMLERGLKKFGCTVVSTDDPPRGLEIAAQGSSDLVLLDWVLPAIPGAQMLERLRRTSASTPVAVMSGALWWEDAEKQIRSLGASEVMTKPIDFERLVEWLRRARRL